VPRLKKFFQLLRRKAKNSKYEYYVSFHLPDGSLSPPRSSGQTSKGAADNWAIEQINEGKIPSQQNLATNKSEEYIAFPLDFLDFDNSKYVRGKLACGQTIGRAHYLLIKGIRGTAAQLVSMQVQHCFLESVQDGIVFPRPYPQPLNELE